MIVVNFAHPLNDAQQAQLEALAGQPITEVRDVPCHFDQERPFAEQAAALIDAVKLSPDEWQTAPIVVNPPGYAPSASALLAELHGRVGHFPTIIRIRPVAGSNPPRYEVAEIINLQAVRDAARQRRW